MDSERSGTKAWTATKSATSTKANQNIYVKAGARLQNTGAEATYFMAVPSASGPTTDKIPANGQYGYPRGFNWSCTQGSRYGLWHQRYDQTLNTEVIDGITSLYHQVETGNGAPKGAPFLREYTKRRGSMFKQAFSMTFYRKKQALIVILVIDW